MKTEFSKLGITFLVISLILLASLSFGGYQYYLLAEKSKESEKQYEENISQLEQKITGLENNLSEISKENFTLSEALYTEQNKNQIFADQISEITGTVGTLEKLSKTDPELLQKYSKVYFLNEHHIPRAIAQIPDEYVWGSKEQWIHANVGGFLGSMLKAAETDGIDLRIISAYRTFHEQASVKEGHVTTFGAGSANQFSAEQGYSEHQLGTAIDFTTPETGASFSKFKNTEAYKWLQDNAYKFGFILSYPEGNNYYIFEPWHWRFVGVKLAKHLYDEGKHFYDMDQREIDEYLVYIFDNF